MPKFLSSGISIFPLIKSFLLHLPAISIILHQSIKENTVIEQQNVTEVQPIATQNAITDGKKFCKNCGSEMPSIVSITSKTLVQKHGKIYEKFTQYRGFP